MNSLEEIILKNLLQNEEYSKRVLPYLKHEYFDSIAEKIIFKQIEEFVNKYNTIPTKEALFIEINKNRNITEPVFKSIDSLISSIMEIKENPNIDWMIESTEKFCQKKSLFIALQTSIGIYEGKDKNLDWGAIPDVLNQALAVSFDNKIGHFYFENSEDRFDYYHRKEEKLSLRLEYFNKITRGGVSKKTLNLLLAGTHVGKSMTMCNLAADDLMAGRNVLYISNEMAEEQISLRIDAYLMDLEIDNVLALTDRSQYKSRIHLLRKKTQGQLVVKEYPMSSAHVGHYKALLNELKLKRNFVPDVIYVDYLNIMLSARLKASSASNMYGYAKAISEELRGLASEFNVPIWSATQFNRGGFSNADAGLEDIGESFGINFTADLILALLVDDEMKKLNQILCKQLKNRYSDMNQMPKFVIGVNRSKQKLYDLVNQPSMSSEDDE